MSVPESIRSAVAECTRRTPVGIRMPVSRGQVRAVHLPKADSVSERMVLMLRVDSHQQSDFAEIMLVHPYTELATGSDLVVSPERSTMPYAAVVQTDTRAVVWTDQIDGLVGAIGPEALEAIGDVALGRPFDREGLAAGMPLRGRLDPRWDFKAQEGSAVRGLAANCTSALLYDGLPLQLDPGCLAPLLIATCDDLESTMYKLVDLVTNYEVVFDLEDVAVLEDVGALKISNWIEIFRPLGDKLYKSFWPLVERALSTVDLPDDLIVEGLSDEWTRARRRDAGTYRRRPGYQVVSASYVQVGSREYSIELANKCGYQLVDM